MITPLEGTWELIRAEQGGESSPELVALGVQLEIAGDTYTIRFAGEIADRGTLTLGPDKTLTLTSTESPTNGRLIPCICQRTGNQLRMCYGLDGTPPDKFATTPGSAHYLATYHRIFR